MSEPCPYVVTSDEGTSYCRLAEAELVTARREREELVRGEGPLMAVQKTAWRKMEADLAAARSEIEAMKETNMEVVGAHSRTVAALAEVSEARTTCQLNIAELVEQQQHTRQELAAARTRNTELESGTEPHPLGPQRLLQHMRRAVPVPHVASPGWRSRTPRPRRVRTGRVGAQAARRHLGRAPNARGLPRPRRPRARLPPRFPDAPRTRAGAMSEIEAGMRVLITDVDGVEHETEALSGVEWGHNRLYDALVALDTLHEGSREAP